MQLTPEQNHRMSTKFELYSSTFLYTVEPEQAAAVLKAESLTDDLALNFYNEIIRCDGVSDCPTWCEFSSTFEISVFATELNSPDCLPAIAKIIDAHIAKCIEIVNV